MNKKRIILPQTSLSRLEKIIQGYYLSSRQGRVGLSSNELNKETKKTLKSISVQDIAGSITFLYNLGIVERLSGDGKYYTLSTLGMEFGEAISKEKEFQKAKYWNRAVNNSDFMRGTVDFIKDLKKVKQETLLEELLARANRKNTQNAIRGAKTIIQILLKARIINIVVTENVKIYEINNEMSTPQFISSKRIDALVNCNKNSKYDLSKLIKLCEEINSNYDNESYYAVGMLIRAVLDHIPPIFVQPDFQSIISHYGGKSFKGHMKTLGEYRHTFDGYLHNQIKTKEDLATFKQIDCSGSIDILLGEVIRLLELQKKSML